MRRGFKKTAEERASQLRKAVGLNAIDPLSAKSLAAHLGTPILSPADIPGLDLGDIEKLSEGNNGWSALTLPTQPPIIIHNPSHSPARCESNLMHEMAHIICGHSPSNISYVSGLPLRDYNQDHEDEAIYLGGALQIPRVALMWAIRQGMDSEGIAEYYGASLQLTIYRRNITGVDRQLQVWKH